MLSFTLPFECRSNETFTRFARFATLSLPDETPDALNIRRFSHHPRRVSLPKVDVLGCEIEDHERDYLLPDICAKDEHDNGGWSTAVSRGQDQPCELN